MSRVRIVKGKYTKIVGGDYNISAEGNIVSNAADQVLEKGTDEGVSYGDFERKGSTVTDDFDMQFSLKKDSTQATVVPLGVLDFEGNFENAFFSFNFSLSQGNVDALKFEILDADGKEIYAITNLPEIVVTARRYPDLMQHVEEKKPVFDPEKPKNIWEWKPVYDLFNTPPEDYTKIGTYVLLWDGFNNDGIYDSSLFNDKTLTARVTGEKAGKKKMKEVSFHTSRKKAEWVDVKINKNSKRVDVNLKVDLTDGGNEGINSGSKVSAEALAYYNQVPYSSQVTSYADIEKYALDGIARFWSRNSGNIGKGVNVNSELYEVFVTAKVDGDGLAAPKIIYQTNTESGRSRNWELSRILYFYEGYLYYDDWKKEAANKVVFQNKGWYFKRPDLDDFKMVAAHEIGHEILLTYGGAVYSKTHKGTSHWSMIIQDPDEDATYVRNTPGEIDLMKYYHDYYDIPRTIISEFDLLKVIWLTKIKIK